MRWLWSLVVYNPRICVAVPGKADPVVIDMISIHKRHSWQVQTTMTDNVDRGIKTASISPLCFDIE